MPTKRTRATSLVALRQLKPVLKPLVEPVLTRLERQERLLKELTATQDRLLGEVTAKFDLQFKRTATIQAQLDRLIATLSKRT